MLWRSHSKKVKAIVVKLRSVLVKFVLDSLSYEGTQIELIDQFVSLLKSLAIRLDFVEVDEAETPQNHEPMIHEIGIYVVFRCTSSLLSWVARY